jgi:anaerobic magnesium-protoporphyrin IX monomethyl ester cyclase
MSSILLASTYFSALDPKQMAKRRPYPPLGTLYAAAALRAHGHQVSLFDAMLAPDDSGFHARLAEHRPSLVVFYEDSFNFLSKMCLSRMREAVLDMIGFAAAQGATVIAAGADMTDHPSRYLRAGAQYVLAGEADHTITQLAAALAHAGDVRSLKGAGGSGDINGINGLVFEDAGAPDGLRRTGARAPERHPNRFPFPAWDLVDIERYRRVWREAHGYFSLNMVSTRGCPFHCNWCAKPIWGQRYAMRSAGNVAEELALLKHTIAPDHIWFADDIFGLRPEWVAEFAASVRVRDARVPFTMQSRADLMTDAAVAALTAAGCREVWLGVESGSQKILDAMNKGIRVDDVTRAARRLKSAGIRVAFFLQFGYPGETLEDVLRTVDLVREVDPDDLGVSVSYPLPGTAFHGRVQAQLGSKTHWTDSGDLAMMFKGTYDTAFYRRLHTLLHQEVELRHRANGHAAAADPHAREALRIAWTELIDNESRHRNEQPTMLPASDAAAPAPPDLTRSWN